MQHASGGEPLVATNHYRELSSTATSDLDLYRTTCNRYDALCEFFAGTRRECEVEDNRLLYILSDPQVMQSITAQHILIRPRSQQIRLLVPRALIENQV